MLRRVAYFFSVAGILYGLCGDISPVHADSPKPNTESRQTGLERMRGKNLSGESRQRRPPLPAYFGQIGISDQQRLNLQAVQMSYEERLDQLRHEIQVLTKERDGKLEALLTDGQKLRLNELRSSARQKSLSKKGSEKK